MWERNLKEGDLNVCVITYTEYLQFFRTCVCYNVPHSRGKSLHHLGQFITTGYIYRKHGLPNWLKYRWSFPAQFQWANCVYSVQCTKSSFEEHFLEHTQKAMSPSCWDEKHLIKKKMANSPSLLLSFSYYYVAFVSYYSLFQSIFSSVSNFSLRLIRALTLFSICLVEIICQNCYFLPLLVVKWLMS
jgi:hypothetical protein